MSAALILTALLVATPAQTIAPGLWRLESRYYFMPMLPDNLASLVIETVCVGDDPTLDPRNLKPKPANHQNIGTVAGDLTRAYAVRFGGSAHISPGFVIEAERLGDCPKAWKPGDRRQDRNERFTSIP
ncbi:hypothetical protein [Caulobacter sp. NIBR2454]|uniref:hypothetical protein n=1 Tax=Caulobacter sp. NIBR2454 TaxID=3015996 RepID=UPI0022B5F418|nr:hypothetical protein [Caulobacter sp. NIBR2454]